LRSIRPACLAGPVQRADTAIKAGSYAVNEGATPHQLLDKLLKGKVTQGELILVEGWTFRQWRARWIAIRISCTIPRG
jgi:UPF0755 protein